MKGSLLVRCKCGALVGQVPFDERDVGSRVWCAALMREVVGYLWLHREEGGCRIYRPVYGGVEGPALRRD